MKNKYKIIPALIILFLFISYAEGAKCNKNKSSVEINIYFNGQRRSSSSSSSGFLLKKENKFFVVITAHCLHAYENWSLERIDLKINNGKYFLKISNKEFQENYAIHKEGVGEYIDVAIIELTNIKSFRQLQQNIKSYFLDYYHLATEKIIDNIDRNELIFIHSIYGVKQANIEERMPFLRDTQQRLFGFQIINCTPMLNRGDSGSLIIFQKDGIDYIIGMVLKIDTKFPSIAYAVDSIRIRETIDDPNKTFR
jgi:hypothetical protein